MEAAPGPFKNRFSGKKTLFPMEAVRTAVVAAGLPLILKDRNNAPDFPPPRLRDTPDPEALRPASAPMMWFYQMTTTVWDGARSPNNAYEGAVKCWRRLRARAGRSGARGGPRGRRPRRGLRQVGRGSRPARRGGRGVAVPEPVPRRFFYERASKKRCRGARSAPRHLFFRRARRAPLFWALAGSIGSPPRSEPTGARPSATRAPSPTRQTPDFSRPWAPLYFSTSL